MRTHHHTYVRDMIASDLVDRATIAQRLGVSSATVAKWSRRGTRARGRDIPPLPCIPIVTGMGRIAAVVYYWPTVERWARHVITVRRGTIPNEWTPEVYAQHLGNAGANDVE